MLNGGPVRAKDEVTMLVRLLVGLVKGIVLGGLIGLAVASLLGPVPSSAVFVYLAAALVGALVGLVAGKPIWSADGKIEAGLKAGFGALLSLGLLWLVRRFVTVPLPISLGQFADANRSIGETALTSLALVGGALGAFYDADNTPAPPGQAKPGAPPPGSPKARIGAGAGAAEEDLGLDEDVPSKKQMKR